MKNPIFILLMFCLLSLQGLSQTDSLKHHLIPEAKPSIIDYPINILPPDIGINPIIYPPVYPPPYIDDIWWSITDFTISGTYWIAPTCGETFHENGQMASKIECQDSILHGKATYWNDKGQKTSETYYLDGLVDGTSTSWNAKGIKTYEGNYVRGKQHGKVSYWDDSGHKTSEYTYAYDRVYKEKMYEGHSKIESIEHYKYDEEGEQLLHGTCTYYTHDGKFIKRYKNGLEHGLYEEFHNGIKTEEKIFKDGSLIDDKAWDYDGNFIYQGTYNQNGDLERIEQWDANGTVVKQNYYTNKRPSGVWLTYEPNSDYKTLTYYSEEGHMLKQDCFTNTILTQRHIYANNIKTDFINYHSNGIKANHQKIMADGTNNYQSWTKFNYQTENTTWRNNKLIGDGIYHLKDTLYLYYEASDLNDLPLKRSVIFNKDTIRQDYVINSSLERHQILQSNHYTLNDYGRYTRSGVWSFYDENTISHALTYVDGNITGRAVYYASDSSLKVNQIGFYNKGVKHGNWLLLSDSTKEEFHYHNGELNGNYTLTNADNDTLVSAVYKNNVLNGVYVEYSTKGSVILNGLYIDGFKTGVWSYFENDGTPIESGEYEHDKRVGKWVEWYYNEKGKLKKRKVNYDKVELG